MFSENLKRLMAERGMTAEQLAARIQLAGGETTYGTVQSWIAGRREPMAASARFIADAIGCTMDELFGRKPDAA